MWAVEARELGRSFRTRKGLVRRTSEVTQAVRGVSFTVAPGELFGLLGPNGAGKTTTIKLLTTLLLPTSGMAMVLGHDVVKDVKQIRRRIGHVSGGDKGLYDRLSGRDNLRYFAALYGLDHKRWNTRIGEVLDLVELSDKAGARVETYSRGMRQRLHIARGLLHEPDLIFLDEPSIGLDALAARGLRTIVKNLTSIGTTVVLTTHYMAEADELCERIAVIEQGRLCALGTPADLKKNLPDHDIVEIDVHGASGDDIRRVGELAGVGSVSVSGHDQVQTLTVQTTGPNADGTLSHSIVNALRGIRTSAVRVRQPTLEDAYVSIINGARESAGDAGNAAVNA